MRKVFFVFLMSVSLSVQTHAQVAITSDILNIAHLTQLIDSVYATYDHIMTTVEMVQNTYQQLEKQIKMLETINWDDITDVSRYDGKDPRGAFLEFRTHYKDSLAAVDRNMNLFNDIADTFNKKKISFGGKNYTLGGLLGTPTGRATADRGTSIYELPNNIWDYIKKQTEEAASGYAGKMTDKQRQAIMAKYGLSARNYYKVRLLEERTSQVVDQLMTWDDDSFDILLKQAIEDNNAIIEMGKLAKESIPAQIDVLNQNISRLPAEFTLLRGDIKNASKYLANNHVSEMAKKEAQADQMLAESLNHLQEEYFRRAAIQINGF